LPQEPRDFHLRPMLRAVQDKFLLDAGDARNGGGHHPEIDGVKHYHGDLRDIVESEPQNDQPAENANLRHREADRNHRIEEPGRAALLRAMAAPEHNAADGRDWANPASARYRPSPPILRKQVARPARVRRRCAPPPHSGPASMNGGHRRRCGQTSPQGLRAGTIIGGKARRTPGKAAPRCSVIRAIRSARSEPRPGKTRSAKKPMNCHRQHHREHRLIGAIWRQGSRFRFAQPLPGHDQLGTHQQDERQCQLRCERR